MSERRDVRRVRVVFDAVAQRWELADDGVSGRHDLEGRADGVSIGRTDAGTVVELVIDVDDPAGGGASAITLQLVRDHFGEQVAELVGRGTPDRDVDVLIDLPMRTPAPLVTSSTPPIADGEPGIPTPLPDGSYAVPSGRTVLTLEVFPDRLVIRAPRDATATDTWAIVATADRGDVVAMAPMEPSGDGGTAAHLSFGLPIAPEALYVATTDEPLASIDERSARQRQWARQLLDDAERVVRLRPRRARRDATTAHAVSAALADDRLVDRAARVTGRARRNLRLWILGITVAIAATVTAVIALAGDSGSTHSTPTPNSTGSTVYFTNCDAARAAGPTPLHRDDPGYRPGLDRDGDGVACEG